MNAPNSLEKSETYLHLHLTHDGPGGVPAAVGPFITLSRESGTGGSVLARALAEKLPCGSHAHGWTVYGSNLIEEMLRGQHLPPQLARFLPEDRIGEFDASIGEIVGLHPNLWSLLHKTNDLVRELARAGNAILLGRGANFVTSGIAHGVHVRLVAAEDHRAQRTARWLALPLATAQTHNQLRDAARRRYVRANFAADSEAPQAYDVVFNVASVPLEVMVATVVQLVERQTAAQASALVHS